VGYPGVIGTSEHGIIKNNNINVRAGFFRFVDVVVI
jgi:hypothetical protein